MKRILRYMLIIALSGIAIVGYDRSVIYSPMIDKDILYVPNVIGMGVEGSKEILLKSGFVNIRFSNDMSMLDQNELVVERQNIAPGDYASKNDEVVLTCKKAKILKCVNVRSLDLLRARRMLTEAGITHIRTNINEALIGHETDEWIVTEQSILPNQEMYEYEEVMLSCEKGSKVRFILTSKDHWVFDTYPVSVYIDGQYFTTLSDGTGIDTEVPLLNGSHTVTVYNHNDHSVYDTWCIEKTDNSIFRATIEHRQYISISPY